MNEWFYEKGNKANIYDEDNKKREEVLTHNIRGLLIIENNIEYIVDAIKAKPKNKEKICKKYKGDLLCNIIFSAIAFISSSFLLSAAFSPNLELGLIYKCYALLFTSGISGLCIGKICQDKIYKKRILGMYDIQLTELNKTLKEEKKKLELIKSQAKKKTTRLSEPELISKSQVIRDLENKLDLIYGYKKERKRLISDYKNNLSLSMFMPFTGQYLGPDTEEMKFIKFLIETELENELVEHKQKGKQKVKNIPRSLECCTFEEYKK